MAAEIEKAGKKASALLGQTVLCLAARPWKEDHPDANQRVLFGLSGKNRILYVDTRPGKKYKLREEDDNVFVLAPSVISRRAGFLGRLRLHFHLRLSTLVLRLRRPVLWAAGPRVKEAAFALKKRASCLVYFGAFDAEALTLTEEVISLIKKADLCLYADEKSFELCGALHPASYCLSPAVEYAHFAEASRPGNRPSDLRAVPSPIAGYAGPLESFDFEGFERIAKANPAVSFVFTGEIDAYLAGKYQAPNIYFLGKKAYEELPYVMRHFDVHCLYLKREDERSPADGRLVLEYLATGKPVVVLPPSAVEKWGDSVYAAENSEEFNELLREAIMEDEPGLPERRMSAASGFTWENTAREAGELVSLFLKGTPASALPRTPDEKQPRRESAPRL